MRIHYLICVAVLALLAGACGSDDPPTVVEPAAGGAVEESTIEEGALDESPAEESAAPTPALAGPGDVPDLDMIDVHTGEAVNLQAVVTGETPLLFWFWAPH